jgi:hypothetical protein
MRIAVFVIALLLLAGSVAPTQGWLITVVVLSGIAALRPRFSTWLRLRPRLDLRLATFIIAVLLLAGAVDPTRGWLIALSAVSGAAMIAPGLLSIGGSGGGWRRDRRARRSDDWCGTSWASWDAEFWR